MATKGHNRSRFLKLLSAALFAATGMFASTAIAADAEGPNTGNISVSGGVDFTNQYWFRGIAQQNQGVIAQPWLELGFALSDNSSLTVGTWNSLHEANEAVNPTDIWYEADWYVGYSTQLCEAVSLDLTYTVLYGPSASLLFSEEIGIGLSIDEGLGLNSSVTLIVETDGGSDGAGGDLGTYLEVGVEPEFALSESESFDLTLTVPVTVGVDINDYYEDGTTSNGSNFGFADVGFVVSTPMKWVGAEFGEWTLSAGVHLLWAGNGAQQIGETAGVIGGGDHFHVYGTLGIGFEY